MLGDGCSIGWENISKIGNIKTIMDQQMKNRVYYGQYSLKYWIELMLSKNIICPPYQRRFVWRQNDVENFIKNIKDEDLFIPPITIGVVKTSDNHGNIAQKHNYIIDGQQRLTSLLLTYYRVLPKPVKDFREENSIETEDERKDEDKDVINKWQFEQLLDLSNDINKIREEAIKSGKYNEFEIEGIDDKFFSNHFIGFSYIVPDPDIEDEQTKYFSRLFNTLNAQGTPLTPRESRYALYFMNSKLEKWFNPEACKNIIIYPNATKGTSIDFVRYISIITDYVRRYRKNDVLKGYDSRGGADGKLKTYEEYYRKYIYSVVDKSDDDIFGNFSQTFGDQYEELLNTLSNTITQMDIVNKRKFESIVDSDFYFFGLVYYVIFKRKNIDASRSQQLTNLLNKKIDKYRREFKGKNVSTVENIRTRIKQSIAIYSRYTMA